MNAQQLSWAYLIREGCIYKEFSFWGGDYTNMPVKTKKCLEDIQKNGIDWEKSGEPSDGYRSEFGGTFSDPIDIKTLEGVLVSNSGKKYNWGCRFAEPRDVFEIMAEFYKLQSVEEIIEELLK